MRKLVLLAIATFSLLPVIEAKASCAGSGSITHEKWNSIGGFRISDIPLATKPSSVGNLTQLEINNLGDYYGTRISGYICPPVSGNYYFLVSGDDATRVSISSSDSPLDLKQVAGFEGYTSYRQLNKLSGQRSQAISLVAGRKYFFEVLHKEGNGGDHLTVGWDMPDGKREFPLPGSRLFPKDSTAVYATCSGVGSITHEKWDNASGFQISDIPLTKSPSSSKTLSKFEFSSLGDNYGTRVSGYICPPLTGNYIFHVSGDDAVKVSVSNSDSPTGLKEVAGFNGYTDFQQLNKFSGQKSAPVALLAGKKYFVEVLHKEGNGGDHLSVGWDLPNGKREFPLPAARIAPKPIVTIPPEPPTCTSEGKISLERYLNVNTTNPLDLLKLSPSALEEKTLFEAPTNFADYYGTKMSGYICVPATGDYTFYISGDDQVALFLSSDESSSKKVRIAYHDMWTNPREYSKYATQTSSPVRLEAGRRYYIEALQVDGNGGDNLSVGWKLPNGTLERPIPGSRLSRNPNVGTPTTPSPGVALLFQSFFETLTDLNQWAKEVLHEKSATISSEQARSGSSSLKIVLNRDEVLQSNLARAELKLQEETLPLFSERWYGFSIFLPSDYVTDDIAESLFQMRSVPNSDETWSNVKPTPMMLKTEKGRYVFQYCISKIPEDRYSGWNCYPTDLGAYEKGKWVDWVIHMKLTYKNDGVIEVFKNGQRVVHVENKPTFYNDEKGPYFKMGIYKWGWQMTNYPTQSSSRTVYYDNVRIGDGKATFGDVSPAR